jgi:hypothetical protein
MSPASLHGLATSDSKVLKMLKALIIFCEHLPAHLSFLHGAHARCSQKTLSALSILSIL